jgi:hypothetical protein
MSDQIQNDGSNLKALTPELFEAGGVPVTEKPAEGLTPRQPISPNGHKLRCAAAAMARLEKGQDWEDWKLVLPVLPIAREAAMYTTSAKKPTGARYNNAFKEWFERHPEFAFFGNMDKGLRARFFRCAEHISEIDAWWQSLPFEQRIKLNYPTTVLSHWERRNKPKSTGKHREKTAESKPLDLIKAVNAATDVEITEALIAMGFDRFLRVMPNEWRPKLEARSGSQIIRRATAKNPNIKAKHLRLVSEDEQSSSVHH